MSIIRKSWAHAFSALGIAVALTGAGVNVQAGGWCKSNELDSAMRKVLTGTTSSCPPSGPCDLPATRNLYPPDASQPIIWIRTHVTILRNTDGTNAAASASDVTNSMNQLNTDFLPARIQFLYDWNYYDNSTYRTLTSAEDFSMKCASAVKPDSTLNIWVTDIADAGVLGYSYLPWSGNALSCTYGCVIEQTSTGGFGGGRHVLTHEVGHALGLYHTFHGVDEVPQCSACYENPSDPDADNLGDFCSDTRPTPTNYTCGDIAGSSPCNSQPWAPTDYLNYMGYASTTCQTHFSPQQMERMRCWTQNALAPYILGVRMAADTTFGPSPLTVNFSGMASQTASAWSWNFGDGQTSTLQNPTHTYGPGYFDVSLTIQTAPPGPYTSSHPGFISVYADSIQAQKVAVTPGKPVKIDVVARNYIPLTAINIPFTWASSINVVLDSVRNGTRTIGWPIQLVQLDNLNKRRTYGFDFTTGGPQPTLPAGDGPVLSLWFRIPPATPQGTTVPIGIISYGYQTPNMTCVAGNYPAIPQDGAIIACLAGDVNNDGQGPDIADIAYLIAYLYMGGPPPPLTAQADCDGTPGVDIGDLSALIDHLFISLSPITCGS